MAKIANKKNTYMFYCLKCYNIFKKKKYLNLFIKAIQFQQLCPMAIKLQWVF